MKKSRENSKQQSALWIYNPGLDLIVGCGAWSAPLLLLSYFSAASSARAWSVAFYVLALFFNYPHYMATIYRAYHRSERLPQLRRTGHHWVHLADGVLSHFWLGFCPGSHDLPDLEPVALQRTTTGLFMMFAPRPGPILTRMRRSVIRRLRSFVSDSVLSVSTQGPRPTRYLFRWEFRGW